MKIADSKYEKVDLRQVARNDKNLPPKQRKQLYKFLVKYTDLFDCTQGAWKTEPVDFELVDRAKSHSQRHYPMPHLYNKTFKKRIRQISKVRC